METSIFTDKNIQPDDKALLLALADTYSIWQSIKDYVHRQYPPADDEWNYSGEKHGWNYRIKDKKRAIVYLLPRDRYFKAAFVFGQKSTDRIMESGVADTIKTELASARVYAEGRGIRIEIRDDRLINDIKQLIDIKLAF